MWVYGLSLLVLGVVGVYVNPARQPKGAEVGEYVVQAFVARHLYRFRRWLICLGAALLVITTVARLV